jgi:hypothetical protein
MSFPFKIGGKLDFDHINYYIRRLEEGFKGLL